MDNIQDKAKAAAHMLTWDLLDEDLKTLAAPLKVGMTGFDELVKVQELRNSQRIIDWLKRNNRDQFKAQTSMLLAQKAHEIGELEVAISELRSCGDSAP